MDSPTRAQKLLAEAIGTAGFFFIGFTGIAAAVEGRSGGGALVAAGFGLGLALMIAAFGQVSGGHFNPAVSLGLAVAGKFKWADVLPYWGAQLVGGLVAALVATQVYSDDVGDQLVTQPGVGVGSMTALLLELIATMFFLMVIVSVATDERAPWNGVMAPLAIGGFIFTAAITVGAFSGGSFNPARSIAPAIVSGQFGSLWIYIVAPLAGGVIGGAITRAVGTARG